MSAIENIRRDLREKAWLRYTDKPFAGAVHNFNRPLRERFKSRECCGPYYYSPAKPGGGRGFYQHAKYLACGDSAFALRLEDANEHLGRSRLSNISGYYTDDDEIGETLQPIIARLPRQRGFLAGWTMGNGMCGSIDLAIHGTEEGAARAAHFLAEADAEKEREYHRRGEDES